MRRDTNNERKADLNIDTWTESREPEGRAGAKGQAEIAQYRGAVERVVPKTLAFCARLKARGRFGTR